MADPHADVDARLLQTFRLAFAAPPQCKLPAIFTLEPQTILITGLPGIGKSFLVDSLTHQFKVKCFRLTLGELAADFPANLDKGMRHHFALATKNSPAVLLLDNVELIFPRKGGEGLSLSHCFAQCLEEYLSHDNHRVLVIATSQKPHDIDPFIRKRFQDELLLDIPTPDQRHRILTSISTLMTLHPSTNLKLVSSRCHGYVAADLMALCQVAEEIARWRRYEVVDDDPRVNQADFEEAFTRVRITNLRNQTTAEKVPPVFWSDVGGLVEVKNKLEESVIWIYKHADAYRRLGIKPSKGVLLYGPPGTGKTLLAKAIATESSANFLPISIPDLIKGEVGESEKAVVNMFRVATRCSPCVVFLDELEALFGRREASGSLGKKLISQLLLELDALDSAEQSVVILAATNHPEIIDPAILRPGRLDRLIYVPPPPVADRLSILRVLAQTMRFSPHASLDEVARRTEGYTGADLGAVARKAGLLALRRGDGGEEIYIEQEDLLDALKTVKASVTGFQEARYRTFGLSQF